ncbi:hypothetical protein E3E35_07040 [Thermococcus sp. GR7]|uniref:hypothetical protein n=1 Tax=unclassified Thermococcus TaxID=2627626 RepID=UPI00142F4F38|nr:MULTISPECIES: hypothetical protein [unclassified Thermococcus]NJE47160.1 hypothetical protein [Thermococcus sp. GR7]NJE78015.1 hypothetical protein [Thermococcus sp. GR4]NJF22868.1 hypothetical protein [Thermococcus sp. GR5]
MNEPEKILKIPAIFIILVFVILVLMLIVSLQDNKLSDIPPELSPYDAYLLFAKPYAENWSADAVLIEAEFIESPVGEWGPTDGQLYKPPLEIIPESKFNNGRSHLHVFTFYSPLKKELLLLTVYVSNTTKKWDVLEISKQTPIDYSSFKVLPEKLQGVPDTSHAILFRGEWHEAVDIGSPKLAENLTVMEVIVWDTKHTSIDEGILIPIRAVLYRLSNGTIIVNYPRGVEISTKANIPPGLATFKLNGSVIATFEKIREGWHRSGIEKYVITSETIRGFRLTRLREPGLNIKECMVRIGNLSTAKCYGIQS